jgi:hypothetical protein
VHRDRARAPLGGDGEREEERQTESGHGKQTRTARLVAETVEHRDGGPRSQGA